MMDQLGLIPIKWQIQLEASYAIDIDYSLLGLSFVYKFLRKSNHSDRFLDRFAYDDFLNEDYSASCRDLLNFSIIQSCN